MIDAYFHEHGDIAVTPAGDIALTLDYGKMGYRPLGFNTYISQQRFLAQQAFIRLMTEIGDYTLYPTLGSSLQERLTGMPNTPETAEIGKDIIRQALTREPSPLSGVPITVEAFPISPTAVRFDIYLTIGNKTEMALSIKQELNTTFALES